MPGRNSKSKKPKQSRSHDDDDSSIDSRRNIRKLIDYECDDDDDDDSSYDSSDDEKVIAKQVSRRHDKKKASLKLKKDKRTKIKRKGLMSKRKHSEDKDGESSDSDVIKEVKKSTNNTATKKKKRAVIESDEETALSSSEANSSLLDEEEDSEDDDIASPKEKASKDSEDSEENEGSDSEAPSSEEGEDGDKDKPRRKATIDWLVLGGGGDEADDPNEPKKYKMKKESSSVRRFVELLQKQHEGESAHIDNDITYFKTLPDEKQLSLLTKLECRASKTEKSVPLKFQILDKATTAEVQAAAMSKFQALTNIDPSSTEFYKCSQWINGFIRMPLGIYKSLPVNLDDGAEKCSAFVSQIQKSMDAAIYGQDEAKLQILQFVSAWIANPSAAGNVLSIHGEPGVGKTTLVKEGIAKALGRPFHFITLGGATDASFLDGHSYTYEGSTWGRIAEVLIQSQCMNPVIYFDELDKVSETPKGEEIINLLVHLTDGAQNTNFQDKYFSGIDLDLSRCLFIFSHNNENKINPILRDRMYNIKVHGFNTKEKIIITEQYLLPAALKDLNLFEKVGISKDVIKYIIENHTAGEPGVREMKRAIQTILSKINLLRFYNDPKAVPFSIPNFHLPFNCTKENIDIFLKKKNQIDASIAHLYV